MKSKINIKNLSQTALLLLFGWFWVASSLFTHLHSVDGKLTAHSHPFTSSTHSHSSAEFFNLQQFSTFDDNSANSYADNYFFVYTTTLRYVDAKQHIYSFIGHCKSLRAPPVFSFV